MKFLSLRDCRPQAYLCSFPKVRVPSRPSTSGPPAARVCVARARGCGPPAGLETEPESAGDNVTEAHSSQIKENRNCSSSPKERENERSFRSRRPAQPSAGRPGLRSGPLSFGRPSRSVTWPTLQRTFSVPANRHRSCSLNTAREDFLQPVTSLIFHASVRLCWIPAPECRTQAAPVPCRAAPVPPNTRGASRLFQRGPEAQARCAPPSSFAS